MIDPTASLPLHFTVETVILSAAGLVLAWAVMRGEWLSAAAAAFLAIVQGAHAGQFIQQEDEPVLYGVRLASTAAMGFLIVRSEGRRLLIGGGLAAIFAGSLWGAVAGGGAEDLALVPHVLLFAGAVALIVWVWHATRPSVRLRVLAAFISVLAVAVVVAGGAVARVAAVDARNERYGTLSLEASAIVREVVSTRDVLRRRAATLSPGVATGTAVGEPRLERSRVLAGEWVVILDRDGESLTATAAEGVEVPHPRGAFAKLPLVERASRGDVSSSTSVTRGALQVIAAAPIFEPGSAQRGADVIGSIVVGQTLPASELRGLTGDPLTEVATVGPGGTSATDAGLGVAAREIGAPRDVSFDTIGTREDGGWLASIVPLPDGPAYLVVAAADDIVVEAATDLVRAFLVAILAAALLAVVAALWIASRITRPMLQLADDAERVKTDFLASVSHELRTPLTPIRGYTELLRSRSVPARDAGGYLDEIGLATQRLERIVSLLVDVAAIEAGRFRVQLGEVAPSEILDGTIERWAQHAPRPIEVFAPDGSPAVLADGPAIARVLDELIDNAVKFAPEGTVELRARQAGDRVEFSVRDDGPGIDPERMKAVREAFHQEESGDSRRFGGLGLGLAFVEGVLAAHGSRLDIESSVAGSEASGTTCTFALPVATKVGSMPKKKAQTRRR